MKSRANEHVVALDGLAIVVHKANPVTTLEREKVQRIFSGRITNWSQVGGADLRINLYARDDKSGTFESFKTMVLRDEKISSRAKRFEDSEELSRSVAADESGSASSACRSSAIPRPSRFSRNLLYRPARLG